MLKSSLLPAIVAAAALATGCAGAAGTPPSATRGLIELPSRALAPRSARFRLLLPLQFNGSAFAEVPVACARVRRGSAPPYVPPVGGSLQLSGNVVLVPACLPAPPPAGVQVYVVAIAGGRRHRGAGSAPRPAFARAVPIAGPSSLTDDPWSFAPLLPAVSLRAGAPYRFFVGIAARAK